MIRVAVQPGAIDMGAEFAAHDAGGHGATASFIGRVRGDGGLAELFLDHHPAMTQADWQNWRVRRPNAGIWLR
jgi:molybdopterin synthase catalytic subunit